jgi:hypothetical protein
MNNIIGSVERISFPDFGIVDVLAKVDTGAYTGSIHCHSMKMFKTKSGKRRLRFVLIDAKQPEQVAEKFKRIPVTSSNGETEYRYAVYTHVVVGGQTYPIRLTLAKRTGMRYPVLLGRRFLRKNKIMVDVSQINK